MNGGTKKRLSTISLGRLQCVRRVSAGPTGRIKRRRRVWIGSIAGRDVSAKGGKIYLCRKSCYYDSSVV
jgi:hypothetical protein